MSQGGPADDPQQNPLADARQSPTALAIQRGASRLLLSLDLARIPEFTLPSGRRADLLAVSAKGDIWIVEIKSSVKDFLTDQKWGEYRDYCDRLLFAVEASFPLDLLPADAGVIVADRFGGELVRPAPEHRLTGARRKALLLQFARAAAFRLHAIADPELSLEALARGA